MGYALDGGWRGVINGTKLWLPYIKHCTVSGMNSDCQMWLLDGINYDGFSGGPVFIGTGNDLKIAAVISGYYREPAKVIRGDAATRAPDAPKDVAAVNSGFIIAYDISHPVKLIKQNPTGPIRQPKQ